MDKNTKKSLFVGFAGLFLNFVVFSTLYLINGVSEYGSYLPVILKLAYVVEFSFYFGWLIALVGLFFGILGFRKGNTKIAVFALLLSFINLTAYCLLFLLFQKLAGV